MNIRLHKLIITNFKGITHREIDFDGDMNIYGANGTGKTTIYDAFYWLLFNKDSKCRADFDVKPMGPDGEVINHGAQTEVIGHVSFDGAVKVLRKIYYEKWSTKRGNAEATYDGNTAEYFIDDLPMGKTAYDAAIELLCREKDFQLLSNLTYFNEKLSWQERRNILFGIVDPTAADELLKSPEYADLKAGMGEHSLDDFKKILSQRRKTASDAKKTIPARIDECNRTVNELKVIDFDALKADGVVLETSAEDLKARISEIKNNTAARALKNDIAAAEVEYKEFILDNERYRQSQNDTAREERIRSLESVIRVHADELERMRKTEASLDNQLISVNAQIVDCRKKWSDVSAETFAGLAPCPTCGREYDEDALAKARAQFEIQKGDRLNTLAESGKAWKQKASDLEKELAEIRPRVAEYDNTVRDKTAELEKLKSVTVEIKNLDGYAETKAQYETKISQLKAQLTQLESNDSVVLSELVKELNDINTAISRNAEQLAQKGNILRSEERIIQLNADAAAYTAQINECDRLTALAEQYTKARAALIEDSVNSMFRHTRFKLYDVQINGGLADCCEATYNGIDYNGTLNDGHRILVAMDIINTLSAHYGISVPLFFDNAERYTGTTDINTQIIKMTVSENDRELRIERSMNNESDSKEKGIGRHTAA